MGDVSDFLFGGGESSQTGANQYESEQQSSNQSQQNAVSANASNSSSGQVSSNAGFNQAYAPISAAMTPALGYVTGAGNMMASLLGLPPSATGFSYEQTPWTPPPAPTMPSTTTNITLPDLSAIVDALAGSTPTTPPPAPTPAPNPTAPTPPPNVPLPPPAAPPPTPQPTVRPPMVGASNNNVGPNYISPGGGPRVLPLAQGGAARPGQPYLVGENEPEVFVPSVPGTVVPTGRGGGNQDWRSQVMSRMASRRGQVPLPGGGTGTVTPGTPANPAPPATNPGAPTAPVPGASTPAAASPASALDTFTDSAGMNFILDQGQKAISGASAANGVFNSGATGKALVQYGQGLGQTYLNQYMQHLASLGQLGLGAGSAMSNAGGVTSGSSSGGSSSTNVGGSLSSGSSSGQSTGSSSGGGVTSGSSDTKGGLFPALAGMAQAAAGAGAGGG